MREISDKPGIGSCNIERILILNTAIRNMSIIINSDKAIT